LDIKSKKILTYATYGFVLGLFFPIAATATEFLKLGARFTWSRLLTIHLDHPPMLIIDLTPIVLSASFALIGIQAARFLEKSFQLDEQLKSQEAQNENEQYFLEALIASTSFAVVRLDNNHHIITCNTAFEDLFGYQCDEIIGKHLDDMIASDDLREEASQITKSVSAGNLTRKISQRKKKDGSLVDVEIVGVPVSVGGENIGVLGLYHDITQRINTENALLESEARFKSLFNESPISLWEEDFSEVKMILERIGSKEMIIDRLNEDYLLVNECVQAVKILDINQATLDLYNAKSKTELLQSLSQVLVVDSLEEFRQELLALVSGVTSFECEIYQKKLTGELIYGWLRLSVPPGYEDTWERVHLSIVDITDRKKGEEKLRFMSFHDALTGLYNRAYFEEELNRLEKSRHYPISIITCDLDGLKQINDTLGHDIGDKAIRSGARILGMGTFRKEDIVARIGGDEFVIILPAVDLDQNPVILKRLEQSINNHNNSNLDDDLYRPISMSYGYSVIQQGCSLMDGYKAADRDMYLNKVKKKNQSNSIH
jgi:diguanylate cyclase (GGDEF)-like protein/PAS domain S-box-containing protein